jgi:hypothetical protein
MGNRTNKIQTNFSGGEVTPLAHGRVDLPLYAKSAAKIENFICDPRGGAVYRNGSVFVTNTRQNQPAALIPWQFNDQQAYIVEVTPGYFRFYTDDGIITGTDTVISAATNANPCAITDTAHGYTTGDVIEINDVQGMTQLNGNTYTVTKTGTNTYTIGVDSTAYGTYTASGKATKILNISGITTASPGVITATNHGLSNGQYVFISGVVGINGLQNQQFEVTNVTTNTFELADLLGNPINTIGMGTYVSGGTAACIYEVTTPYAVADIFNLQYAQSADTMYVVHQNYAPYKLVRTFDADWSMTTFSRTGTDPFGSAGNYPRSVSFDSAGRLWYGGTLNNPQTIWGSSAPSAGNTAYDDFTTGTAATNSVSFTLAPLFSGKVDYIEFITNTNQFMVIGCYGSVRTLWGTTIGTPVTPTAVTSQPANVIGASFALAVANGDSTFYIQRAGQRIRSLEYDFYISGYTTKDQTVVSDHLTQIGIQQIVQQRGFPDIMWAVRSDGRFLGFTYSRPEQDNYAAWHRHYLGGAYIDSNSILRPYAKVTSMAVAPRNTTADQVWFAVQRTIQGNTVCSVEYLADYEQYPAERDFYTGDSVNDPIKFANALYEVQKHAVYLDMANVYDGSALGTNANAALTPSAVSGTSVTISSSEAVFTASMVGQEIHKKYDINGNGGGRAQITAYTDSQHVTVKTTVAFDNTNAMQPGAWYLTATSLTGLEYLNGETVTVVTDGGPAGTAIVANGSVTLSGPVTVAMIGYPYTGTIETLNIDTGGKLGSAEAKPRILIRAAIRFLNSLGIKFGTDYYSLDQISFRKSNFLTDRPTPPFTGIKSVPYSDEWTDQNDDPQKIVVLIQSLPLPCTVLGIDHFMMTTDE